MSITAVAFVPLMTGDIPDAGLMVNVLTELDAAFALIVMGKVSVG